MIPHWTFQLQSENQEMYCFFTDLLIQRIDAEQIQEVILALTPSVEGDTTSLYLARLIKPFCAVSRIAYGLPVGSELEYADEVTLSRALEGRRPVD